MSGARKRYRKVAYDPDLHPAAARKMCLLGAANRDLAEGFEVSLRTVERWLQKNSDFRAAVHEGRQVADGRVAESLYSRAVGCSYPEDKVFANGGKPVIVPTVKHLPPDTAACIFWLKNRRPDLWRDRQDLSHAGGLTVNIVKPA